MKGDIVLTIGALVCMGLGIVSYFTLDGYVVFKRNELAFLLFLLLGLVLLLASHVLKAEV